MIGCSMERPETIQIAGQASLGALSAGYIEPQQLKSSASFVSAYTKAYGKGPGPMTNLSYDAAEVLIEAIQQAGTTSEPKLRDTLAKTSYSGASGKIQFDAAGDRTTPYFEILKVEDQGGSLKWVPLKQGAGL